ncbi:hypothetical protein C8R46DRAFT_1244448 [Mycena filopes]|nr:hypothetical protein C8R46DRAFT_1244448 [Mycena filopes]
MPMGPPTLISCSVHVSLPASTKTLASVNEFSAREYEIDSSKPTSTPLFASSPSNTPPPSFPSSPSPSPPPSPSISADDLEATLTDRTPRSPTTPFAGGVPAAPAPSRKYRRRARGGRAWLVLVWAITWPVPTILLERLGRMKRPDVRLAVFMLILFLLNATVVFYIILFHAVTDNLWVAVQGGVYDVSNFVQGDHSDVPSQVSNSQEVLEVLAGQDMTYYLPVPLVLGCPTLITDGSQLLTFKNFSDVEPTAVHVSGQLTTISGSALHQSNWSYTSTFQPKMKNYYKGPPVHTSETLKAYATEMNIAKIWGGYGDRNLNTVSTNLNNDKYNFPDQNLVSVFKQQSGHDITKPLNVVLDKMDPDARGLNMQCLNNVFVGNDDFLKSARQNYLLIIASGILMGSMGSSVIVNCNVEGQQYVFAGELVAPQTTTNVLNYHYYRVRPNNIVSKSLLMNSCSHPPYSTPRLYEAFEILHRADFLVPPLDMNRPSVLSFSANPIWNTLQRKKILREFEAY